MFSRTSIQTSHISPRTPRAIYFNDDTAVGFVQNGEVLELSAIDPRQGAVFYSLDTEKSDRPEFARRDDCLRCHQGAPTMGIPGIMISSVHPVTDAEARESHGSAFITDDRTSFEERWGGWYVTGTHGAQVHLGNNPELTDPLNPGRALKEGTQNVTSLADRFNTSRYLAPTSDIVALMTLEHQTRMTNLMTRIGWDARIALREGKGKMDARRARTHQRRNRGDGRLHAFRGRRAAEGAGRGRLDVYQDVCRARASGCARADHCGISICKSGCSVIRCRT